MLTVRLFFLDYFDWPVGARRGIANHHGGQRMRVSRAGTFHWLQQKLNKITQWRTWPWTRTRGKFWQNLVDFLMHGLRLCLSRMSAATLITDLVCHLDVGAFNSWQISASWDDCNRVFPDELRVSSFPHGFSHSAWTAAMSAHSDFDGSRVYACLGVTCHLHFWQNNRGVLRATAVTLVCNGHRIRVSTQSSLWRRKLSRHSCRDSNSQLFDHESGALTNKLSQLPIHSVTLSPKKILGKIKQNNKHIFRVTL